MESPPTSSEYGEEAFDPSRPFAGVVLCCTSIPPEHRSEIASKTAELGGVHKYDLTPDVTHLIVGKYDTPKYRHVAKERPDIKPMAVGWVDAVRNLWVEDEQIDFGALEKVWCLKTFETGGGHINSDGSIGAKERLLCCLTGFEDLERQQIIEKIKANGGDYTGDLSRLVTHLIVRHPQGNKYNAARNWKIHAVALKWVEDSIQRAMILDERCYDPVLPAEDLGKGAWNRRDIRRTFLGKRQRAATATKQEEGRRKLRKTASMKLNSQRDNMWGEILGQPSLEQSASHQTEEPTQKLSNHSMLPSEPVSRAADSVERGRTSFGGPENRGETVFASCGLHVFGFSQRQTEVLVNTVSSLGGTVIATLRDLALSEGMSHRFVIVPQSADPTSHPPLPDGVEAITECFIERCLHRKVLLSPREHVIGRPFPVFPIEGFDKLSICTAGFTDVDLLQVDRAIRQLGAKFEERFNPRSSLLVCTSLDGIRKQKLDLAIIWKVPVVKAEWLWECISQGKRLSTKDFMFPELRAKAAEGAHLSKPLNRSKSTSDMTRKLTPKSLPERLEKPGRASLPSVDMSAFDNTPLASTEPPATHENVPTRRESNAATDFETAPTHQSEEISGLQRPTVRPGSRSETHPLSEKSASDVNKTSTKDPGPSQTRKPLSRVRSEVCDSEVGDDESLDTFGHDNNAGEDAAELDKRRLEREKAEAGRLALSNKLTTLLGAPSRDGISLDSAVFGVGKEETRPASRRKRDVIGRAISNVSTTSTGSVESSSAVGVFGKSAVVHEDGSQGSDDASAVPTVTQIEYDDIEAKESKARLMSKMLGRNSLVGDSFNSSSEDRVSIAKVTVGEDEFRRPIGGRSMRRR
ncbi:S-M checkpoint control protein rad4 [Cytospora mali]|uniref:S-M checkpoint control protein rad4 n=1 Tax=Cytospora mali TaxID=578113 RepID=A0A194VMH2_CYTMA|nr:S-M checkpoint control protein rad4 [Valsa mali]